MCDFPHVFSYVLFLDSLVGECIKEWEEILSALPSTAPWKVSRLYTIVLQAGSGDQISDQNRYKFLFL